MKNFILFLLLTGCVSTTDFESVKLARNFCSVNGGIKYTENKIVTCKNNKQIILPELK